MKKEDYKYFYKILIETFIDRYNKDKEDFINEIIKTNEFYQIMPAENPVMKIDFKCIKMKLSFSEEKLNYFEFLSKINEESEEK